MSQVTFKDRGLTLLLKGGGAAVLLAIWQYFSGEIHWAGVLGFGLSFGLLMAWLDPLKLSK